MLACSEPFSPFKPDSDVFWSLHTSHARTHVEEVANTVQPQVFSPEPERAKSKGPGKWVLKDIDHDALWNVLTIAANRSGTIANEGSVILSDGKDWANTSRTLIHEWQKLGKDEKHFEFGSAIHRYGDLKRTVQKYVESDDHWALKGQSWHWVPATPDVIFERAE